MNDLKKLAGYLKVYRKFFESAFWQETRQFSKAEAWLDLLHLGAYMPSSKLVRGRLIKLNIGSLVASERFLSNRWNWSKSKVHNFLQMLIENSKITTKKTNGETVITLVNYSFYNDLETTKRPPSEPPQDHRKTKYKESKESKESKETNKGKKLPCCIFDFLGDEFKNSEAFCNIWAEWLSYRKQRRLSPYAEATLKRSAIKFTDEGLELAIERIERSISNSWQGLFYKEEASKSKGLSLREFRIAYMWHNNIHPYGSMDREINDTRILDADLDTIKTKYKRIYEDFSQQASDTYGAMRKFLNKNK